MTDTVVEQLRVAVEQRDVLQANLSKTIADLTAALDMAGKAEADANAARAALAAITSERDTLAEQVNVLTARADSADAELAKARDLLALREPAHAGTDPLAESGEAADQTWSDVVKAHGYAKARAMFPTLYQTYMQGDK